MSYDGKCTICQKEKKTNCADNKTFSSYLEHTISISEILANFAILECYQKPVCTTIKLDIIVIITRAV